MRKLAHPSLQQLIRQKLRNRILFALTILLGFVIVISAIEAALSLSHIEARLDQRTRALQDLVISEILVNNSSAIKAIIDENNQNNLYEPVTWHHSENSAATGFLKLKFPWSWSYQVSLRQVGDQRFGFFVYEGSLLTTANLLPILSYRMGLVLLVCLLIGAVLYPIAHKVPNDLILRPIRDLLQILKADAPVIEVPGVPIFAEIDLIRRDFIQVMAENRRLDDERVEMQRMLTVTQTAQMIAHDMRKPFGLLKIVLEGLAVVNTVEDMKELTTTTLPGLKRSVTQLDAMLNELVSIGVDSEVGSDLIDIRNVIEAAIQSTFQIYAPGGVAITYALAHTYNVRGDFHQIERVICNIVQNAIQAMSASDRLWVGTKNLVHNRIAYVETWIGNSGAHIPESEVKKIFDLFYTSGKKFGTGLGLAIAQKVVRRHGGNIWCESDQINGTRFYFRLPAFDSLSREVSTLAHVDSPIISPATESRLVHTKKPSQEDIVLSLRSANYLAATVGAAISASGRKVTILIADDESTFRDRLINEIGKVLALPNLVNIIEAETTDDAIRLAIEESPDLIFLDIDFPMDSKNGFEVAKILRERECLAEICFHTNHLKVKNDPDRSMRESCHFLAKPVELEKLAQVLVACLAPPKIQLKGNFNGNRQLELLKSEG